jgi:hypothetical protein
MSTISDESASITITLPVMQVKTLRETADRQHISVDELVRRSLDQALAASEPDENDDSLWQLIGLAKDGPTDLSARHDEHFAEKIQRRSS